jgi:multisubunit Na+/H+ antiporter MnhB subunit
MLELYLVLGFVVAAAVVAIEIQDLLAAVISLGAVGFAVAIGFILVQAPDLAIVQIVVEVLTIVFFVAVIFRSTHEDSTLTKPIAPGRIFSTAVYAGFALLAMILGYYALRELPRFGSPLMRVASSYIEHGLSQTGAANLVTAVILDYRALDTLGEATVLFTAVAGILAVMRRLGRR